LGARNLKVINRITKIGYGHLYLREENISFNNNYHETVNDDKTFNVAIVV